MDYRHEWKHEINAADWLILRQRLRAVAQPDPHAVGGSYHVRSLYFENAADRALREKLDGVNRREKFRMRCYDLSSHQIHLEKKSKWNNLGSKESVPLTAREAQAIVDGDWAWMEGAERPLVAELYHKMLSQGLRPRTIVDYRREPYVYAPGNVRVTIDYDIHTGLRSTDFLDPNCTTIPVANGPILLEIKWAEFLPAIIRDAVGLEGRHAAAFSKYAACRCYG